MTATSGPVAGTTGGKPFGTLDLALADSRLAFLLANEARHRALHRVFGCSREDENILTVILALSAASAVYEGTRRVVRAPLHIPGSDLGTGAMLLREAGVLVAGPKVSATPMFGSLLAFALVAGVAVPTVRRAMHAARLAEQRVRQHRIARYVAAAGARGAEAT